MFWDSGGWQSDWAMSLEGGVDKMKDGGVGWKKGGDIWYWEVVEKGGMGVLLEFGKFKKIY